MHLQIHSNKKPYKCEQCAKAFTLQRNLKEHMTTHVELEEFHCTVCKRGFKSPRYLSRHMETHFGEKKYACGFCGRKFLRSDARKAHERTKHLRFSILSKDQKEGKE
ncbi:protein krueppel-like [Ostrinia furnacalis]|uniref:protein krueppel-like n=1 Tax=Ostrinia furnacalis TaxID=93504 RepID=UPI00103A6EB6|nr:protein krueppel-like [Ostrinia furnacalis]